MNEPLLTTITPYWNRPETLTVWLKSIAGATTPDVHHILICVGDRPPSWLRLYESDSLTICVEDGRPIKSIGHYHNVGIGIARSEWVMKLDVDCLAHTQYFRELIEVIKAAQPRQWFNGGMFYLDRATTLSKTNASRMPLTVADYYSAIDAGSKYPFPAGTNFICRREDYLALGGCDPRFRGYGWEDYQQIYMLERHWLNADPLPGEINAGNVTQRCRDEISRRKALELFAMSDRLGLLHCWHPPGGGTYKEPTQTAANRMVLLDYINQRRV